MECINCGARLNKSNVCPECGEDVRIVKKILASANYFYNEGLKRAKVRDLSGAVENLQLCLKYNKTHIEARNVLGLIYFERGEMVDAICEWVISKSYRSKNNLAEKYLDEIQNNPINLEKINQTTKKYNQALLYCKQDSLDLAMIQLKKVLSMNLKLVKGHQLLALLYMQEHRFDQAKKSLKTALRIDGTNVTTLRYMKECNKEIHADPERKKKEKENEDLISYVSGNETIIRPKTFKENSALGTIVNMIIGIAIGALITWFLIVPSVKQTVRNDANKAVEAANETISTKEQTILSLQTQVEDLENQLSDAQKTSEAGTTELASYKQLMIAYVSYLNEDITTAGTALATVDVSLLDDLSKQAYDEVNAQVNADYLKAAYEEGTSAYKNGDYDAAITNFEKIMDISETYEDGDAMFTLAQAYRKNGDDDSAAKYFRKIVTLYPNTERASTAQKFLTEYDAQTTEEQTADEEEQEE